MFWTIYTSRPGFVIGKKGENLRCEGNNYYDINSGKCGIGWHGDKERSKVVGVRLGGSGNLSYVWCENGEEVSRRIEIKLNIKWRIMSKKYELSYNFKKNIFKEKW